MGGSAPPAQLRATADPSHGQPSRPPLLLPKSFPPPLQGHPAKTRPPLAPPLQAALDVTQAVFGAAHPLTAHRLLRLASIRIGQSRGGEAAPLLAVVVDILGPYPEVGRALAVEGRGLVAYGGRGRVWEHTGGF